MNLYDIEQDISTKSNTPQLVDELGQVNYLFSDKTGTLTKNEMNLHTLAVLNTDKVYVFNDSTLQNINDNTKNRKKENTQKSSRLKQISQKINKFGYIGVVYEESKEFQSEYYNDNYGFISSSDSELDEEDHNEIVPHFMLNKVNKSKENITSANEYLNYASNDNNNNNKLPNELLHCLTTLALCHTVEVSEEDSVKQNRIDENICLENFYQVNGCYDYCCLNSKFLFNGFIYLKGKDFCK
ncbi:unnamed protein product [Schistosoma margrebowiei]|uniref:Uncharacterized protein n=1 Tax=Schistosoma margrebowiei TaxID=48269 RepID=A0A183MC76_9TREM|nr:unnamed protein product [Schistosoma margrebowiei]